MFPIIPPTPDCYQNNKGEYKCYLTTEFKTVQFCVWFKYNYYSYSIIKTEDIKPLIGVIGNTLADIATLIKRASQEGTIEISLNGSEYQKRLKNLFKKFTPPLGFSNAKNYPIKFGKYKGNTIDQIASTDEGLKYLDWLRGKMESDNDTSTTYKIICIYLNEPSIQRELNG